MPRKGRPPIPTPLHVLRGTYRPGEHDHVEPVADVGGVAVPDHLSDEARAVWESLAGELSRKELLAPRYALMFEVFCVSADHARRALRVLDAAGPVVQGRKDALVANPAARLYQQFAKLMILYGSEFGLTPAATASIARNGYEDSLRPAVGGDDPRAYLT